jgi:mono/diheme cytochrome c family protein
MKLWLIPCLAFGLAAQDSADFFETKVRPVFATRCAGCHDTKKHTAGLDLTTGAGFARGGDSGPIVNLQQPEESRLLKYISYLEPMKMPPTGKLHDSDLAAIAAWVKAGAKWPDAPPIATTAAARKAFTEGQKRFWSFQPLKNPTPPVVKNASWPHNAIDHFTLAPMEAKSSSPAQPASKLNLIRRVTLSLTGIPPTQEEIQSFLKDESPEAFTKVVDRLLASPRYGERWGRHWMDVARYADSTGADEDHRYPDAWRYRDYVIEAFNKDLPFNEFVRQQIAGDVLPSADPLKKTGLVATGFLTLGPRLIAEQDKPKMLYDFIDEQIDTTTRGFLGLTIACARCHDHKFDPILTKDYYSLAGIFASSSAWEKIEGTVSQMHRAPLVAEKDFAAYREEQSRLKHRKELMESRIAEEQLRWLEPQIPQIGPKLEAAWRILHGAKADPKLQAWVDYVKPNDDVRPHLMPFEKATEDNYRVVVAEMQKKLTDHFAEWKKKMAAWKVKLDKGEADRPGFGGGARELFNSITQSKAGPLYFNEKTHLSDKKAQGEIAALRRDYEAFKASAKAEPDMAVAMKESQSVEQRVFIRGSTGNPGEIAPKQFPIILAGEKQAPIAAGSGRLELANWIASDQNPLTARVIVNRVWQWHFGEGLVRTPSNFGLLGEKPTHPELLDYLASWFIREGWSIKKLNRLILSSSTWRQSSEVSKEKFTSDPDNRLWSRYSRRRLDVEELRDSMLALDGSIDWTMGGTLQSGKGTDGENASGRMSIDPLRSKRRTVYMPLRRSNLPALLNLFDFGDATTTGEGRTRTNVAPQTLFMMNSEFVAQRAMTLADRFASMSPQQRVESAYWQILNRPASAEEAKIGLGYVSAFGTKNPKPLADWQSFYKVLLSSSEFLYVD